nr:hypothetical protein [Tanacetum cinerariifolium]
MTRTMFKVSDINDDFDDINDMVDESMENFEEDTVNVGGVVNTATTGVSVASASVTTAEAKQESGNINKARSTTTLNEPSHQGTGSGSGPRCQDTTLGDADAQARDSKTRTMFKVSDINDDFDDINDMVDESMENFKEDTVNVGGAVDTATTGVSVASASVTTAGVSISSAEPKTPPITTTTAFEDEDLTITQTLIKMRSKKAKEKGVAFRNVEGSLRPTTILPTIDQKDKGNNIMQEFKKPPKNPRKAQIQLDKDLAKRMHKEEMDELERRQSEIAAAEEASKATINQELDGIQAMIKADEKMASRL